MNPFLISLKCGFKRCNFFFGQQPMPIAVRNSDGLFSMQVWEQELSNHFEMVHNGAQKTERDGSKG